MLFIAAQVRAVLSPKSRFCRYRMGRTLRFIAQHNRARRSRSRSDPGDQAIWSISSLGNASKAVFVYVLRFSTVHFI